MIGTANGAILKAIQNRTFIPPCHQFVRPVIHRADLPSVSHNLACQPKGSASYACLSGRAISQKIVPTAAPANTKNIAIYVTPGSLSLEGSHDKGASGAGRLPNDTASVPTVGRNVCRTCTRTPSAVNCTHPTSDGLYRQPRGLVCTRVSRSRARSRCSVIGFGRPVVSRRRRLCCLHLSIWPRDQPEDRADGGAGQRG